jgi:hypothetical protein
LFERTAGMSEPKLADQAAEILTLPRLKYFENLTSSDSMQFCQEGLSDSKAWDFCLLLSIYPCESFYANSNGGDASIRDA